MKNIKTISTLTAGLVLALAASSASAQAVDDTWEISAGYFAPKVSTTVGVDATATNGVDSVSARESLTLKDDFHGAKLEGIWRFADRQRVTAGWYGVGGNRRYSVNELGTVSDPDLGSVDYALDGRATWKTDFDLYRLTYGYDFFQGPNYAITGQIGVYGARLDTRLRTEGVATATDGTVTESVSLDTYNRYKETKYAPGLGVNAEWAPYDRWDVRAGIQGFRTQWGDFDLKGHFYNAHAEVGYKFTPQWTGYAGYDWFDLKLRDNAGTSEVIDGVAYDVTGTVTGRLKVHGPVVGVRASF